MITQKTVIEYDWRLPHVWLPCRVGHIAYFFCVDFYCGVKHLKLLFALEAWDTMQKICEFRDWEAGF